MFLQIFLSPQVKRCAIITYKHGMYDLHHELPNDLRPYIYIYIRNLRVYVCLFITENIESNKNCLC